MFPNNRFRKISAIRKSISAGKYGTSADFQTAFSVCFWENFKNSENLYRRFIRALAAITVINGFQAAPIGLEAV